jgi:hypothetical protein
MSVQQAPRQEPRAPAYSRWARSPLHMVCAGLGPAAGVVAVVYVHDRGWSLPSVLITFAAVAGVIALGLPEAIVGPRRIARVAFGLLPVAASVAGFVLAARLWAPTWPALLVGGLVGSAVGSNLQRMLFPGLAREAEARWRGDTAAKGLVAGPDDWIPGWRDLALLIVMTGTFVVLILVHVPGFAYVIAAVGFAGLFLASAIFSVRRRQPDRDKWRSESLGDAWRRGPRGR